MQILQTYVIRVKTLAWGSFAICYTDIQYAHVFGIGCPWEGWDCLHSLATWGAPERQPQHQRLFPSDVCQAGITPKLFLEERQLKTKIIQKLLYPAKNRLSGSNHKRDSRPAPVPPPPQQHTAGQLPVLPLHLELELPPWAFDRRISRSSNTEWSWMGWENSSNDRGSTLNS